MINVKQMNNYGNRLEKGFSYIKCKSCNKILKVNQIIRKEINEKNEYVILIYYCKGCRSYFLRFKTITI